MRSPHSAWYRKPRTEQEQIEEWLGSRDLQELLAAKDALERQGPEADALLRAIARRNTRKYRAAKKQFRLALLLVLLAVMTVFCWDAAFPGIAAGAAKCLLIPLWLAFPCCLSWYDDYRRHGRRLGNAAVLMHRMHRLTAVVEMIEVMEVGDAQTSSLAAKSLIRLLPELTEADGAMLRRTHHRSLQRALRGYDIVLILAILRAYEKIGDRSDIPYVRRLTQCPVWIVESEQVKETACRTLAVLEANSLRRQILRTSLRAASPPVASAEELLRPLASVLAVEARQLLHESHRGRGQ